jgi:hypothetical protein
VRSAESARSDFGAYWIHPAVTYRPVQPPLHLAQGVGYAALGFEDFRKKAGQAEMKSVGRTGLKGMIASGRKTAPPQVRSEVVLVTNSACPFSLEASLVSPITLIINQFASISGAVWTQFALSFGSRLHPSVYTASRSHTLSAPSVSGA